MRRFRSKVPRGRCPRRALRSARSLDGELTEEQRETYFAPLEATD
ncbi:hypothetical protein [Streptomyces zaomyceticus]